MSAWYQKKWITVLLHILLWTLLFSLPFLLRPNEAAREDHRPPQEQRESLILYFWMVITLIGLFYLNTQLLIPRLLNRKKYGVYAGLLLVSYLAIVALSWLVHLIFITSKPFNPTGNLFFNIFPFTFILAVSTAYRLIRDRITSDRIMKEKETENLKTELSLLRSQVSPHFMFNVLNNMVALARKQSDQLEPSLIKLSSLMRYMLYEADEDRVPLEKEIEYLQSYIDLQRQRFGKNVPIHVNLQNVDNQYEIEPMLLIPFVENAIKHGTGLIDQPQIDIDLRAHNHILQFVVRNRYNPESEEIKDKTSGIGLTNVKRRLNLLYGKGHNLLINKAEGWFTISLQLNLR